MKEEDRGVAVHKLRYYINKFNKEKSNDESIKASGNTKWASLALENLLMDYLLSKRCSCPSSGTNNYIAV